MIVCVNVLGQGEDLYDMVVERAAAGADMDVQGMRLSNNAIRVGLAIFVKKVGIVPLVVTIGIKHVLEQHDLAWRAGRRDTSTSGTSSAGFSQWALRKRSGFAVSPARSVAGDFDRTHGAARRSL